MRVFVTLRQFVDDLKTQRLRTALTVLGITWGTVAVVVLLAFGVGFEAQTNKNMHGIGHGVVIMFGGRTTKPFQGFPEGRYIQFREDDVALMQREISGISQISPEFSNRNTPVRRGTSSATPNITGIYPVYGEMRNIIAEQGGRFINSLDLQERRRVSVLGDELKKLLFGDEDAIGKQVYVGQVPFLVVGVMQHKTQSSSYNSRDQDRVFIPASTHRSIFGDKYLANIIYRVRDPQISETVQTRVYEVLGRRYKFDPTDRDALGIWDTNEFDKFIGFFFLGFKLFMGIVGSFTLTVGGIGVANIMYVVVRERTREIGIKRSVGARRRDILLQFIAETFLLVAVGAVLGFVPAISPMVATATMALLAAIAFFSGLFPARRAAGLDPVECLRY
jgi:putative ABC transport system permease protein